MIVSELENILFSECYNKCISKYDRSDIKKRFEQLRGVNLIPAGVRKNVEHLNTDQITACILSLIEQQAGFSGFTAQSLLSLKPVGNKKVSFYSSTNFGEAIKKLLENQQALESLIEIRISSNECSKKAWIIYYDAGEVKHSYYVPQTNISKLQEGSELIFNPKVTHLSYLTEHTFTPKIWKLLKKKLDIEKCYPQREYSIPQEDKDEVAQINERKQKLGLKSSSRFLNMGVDCQARWVSSETVINFSGYKLILLPKTKENAASIHIDLQNNKISSKDAQTLFNRFLSLLSWCDNQSAILQDGWSGNPEPETVPKRNLGGTISDIWLFDREIPNTFEEKMALSFYRQACNAEASFLISYAIISYYKVIEVKYDSKMENGKISSWFREKYTIIKEAYFNECSDIFQTFEDWDHTKINECIGNFFHDSCRVATAHALPNEDKKHDNNKRRIDPDDLNNTERLMYAVPILRLFARYFIEFELDISTDTYEVVEE